MLSIFSRIIARIAQDQLHEILKGNCISTNNQYALRTLHSTIMCLVNSTEHWCQNSDNQTLNRTIFLDLKKAFDTVGLKILIDKLMKYCVKREGTEWFKSYVSGRRQFFTANGQRSSYLRHSSRIMLRSPYLHYKF